MRTNKDIERARDVLKKLKAGSPISAEDAEILERGTLTCATLNQIESKRIYLKKLYPSDITMNRCNIEAFTGKRKLSQ